MHEYNPLQLPEIISNIVSNLSLEDLNKLSCINYTWYKEVKDELRKRCEKELLECYKVMEKKEKEYEKLYKQLDFDIRYYEKEKKDKKFYKDLVLLIIKQLKTKRCVIVNAMISGKLLIKYNIRNLEYARNYHLSIHKRGKLFYIVYT